MKSLEPSSFQNSIDLPSTIAFFVTFLSRKSDAESTGLAELSLLAIERLRSCPEFCLRTDDIIAIVAYTDPAATWSNHSAARLASRTLDCHFSSHDKDTFIASTILGDIIKSYLDFRRSLKLSSAEHIAQYETGGGIHPPAKSDVVSWTDNSPIFPLFQWAIAESNVYQLFSLRY